MSKVGAERSIDGKRPYTVETLWMFDDGGVTLTRTNQQRPVPRTSASASPHIRFITISKLDISLNDQTKSES
jgi:hypothetical protein